MQWIEQADFQRNHLYVVIIPFSSGFLALLCLWQTKYSIERAWTARLHLPISFRMFSLSAVDKTNNGVRLRRACFEGLRAVFEALWLWEASHEMMLFFRFLRELWP